MRAHRETTGQRYTLGTGVYTCPRTAHYFCRTFPKLQRMPLRPPHYGTGMVAATSFEATLLVPEPTVVTM